MSKQKYFRNNEFLQTKEYNEIRNEGSNMNNVGKSYIQELLNTGGLVGYNSLVIENPKITDIVTNNGYLDFTATYPLFALTVPYIKVNYTDTSGVLVEEEFYNVRIQQENLTLSFTGVLDKNIENKFSVYKIKTQNIYVNIYSDDTYQMSKVTENVPEYSSGEPVVKPLQYLVRDGQGIEFRLGISADAKIENIVSFQEDGIPALNAFFNHSGYLYIADNVSYLEHNIAPLMDVKKGIGLGGLTGVYTQSENGKLGETIHTFPNHALGFGDALRGFGMLINDLWGAIASTVSSLTAYMQKNNNLSDVTNKVTSFNNIKQQATESSAGVAKIATQGIVNAGSNDNEYVTPKKLANYPFFSGNYAKEIRLSNTEYTNDLVSPLFCIITKSSSAPVRVYINEIEVINDTTGNTLSFIVPKGAIYKYIGTVVEFFELR